MHPLPPASPLEVGLDYLTVTAAPVERRQRLWEIGREITHRDEALGNEAHPWDWMGYEGQSTRHLSYGWRSDSAILRASGPLAHELYPKVAPIATNCSRIDLQVTARFPCPVDWLAEEYYAEASDHADERGKRLNVSCILNNAGGSTLYLGSRKSDRFARVYNKRAESGEERYANAWRWEIECKGRWSAEVFKRLADEPLPNSAIGFTVYHYFRQRGLPPPWDLGEGEPIPSPPSPPSGNERRIRWLHDQVSPIVRKLNAVFGPEYMLATLGLSPGTIGPARNPLVRDTMLGR